MRSVIIYPPTDTRLFIPKNIWISDDEAMGESKKNPFSEKSYFLSWARLSPPKRVDIIVDAFLDMPDKNLVFCYGKNDPMKEDILQKIAWKKNIIGLESPDDDSLIRLIQWAIASIYIPIDEDFGMTPVESMSCGTPVIGVAEGGLLETIIEWKTGKLIKIVNDELWIENLKQLIQYTSEEEWGSMKHDCRKRAEDFSLEKFQEKLESLLTPNS